MTYTEALDIINEPEHDKANEMTRAPSENSDQPGRPPSLSSLRCSPEEGLGPYLPIKRTEKTLIRLGGCTDRSDSSRGAHAIL